MISDGTFKELKRLLKAGKPLNASASMTNMSYKTARSRREQAQKEKQSKMPRTSPNRSRKFIV